MPPKPPDEPRTRGRAHRLGPQRNPAIDDAVLTAARGLLAERGYHDTTIDAIAARAGVGRPTVYRRWPTKAHVVHDAVYPSTEPAPPPAAGPAARIAALVSGAYALFGRPAARAGVPGLIAETRSDPALHRRLVDGQLGPVREAIGRALAEGEADGTIRPGIDPDTVVDALAGAAIFAMSVRNADGGDELAARLTDVLLHGVLARD